MVMLEPGINLSGQNLSGLDFTGQDGTGANLFKITAQGTIFDDTILIDANFGEADLFGASFIRADLTRVNFFKATLKEADFTNANLTNAILREATLETIKLIKETGPPLDESALGDVKKNNRKSRERMGSGSRSARPNKVDNGGSGEHSPIQFNRN